MGRGTWNERRGTGPGSPAKEIRRTQRAKAASFVAGPFPRLGGNPPILPTG
jgi:hypothetical protein